MKRLLVCTHNKKKLQEMSEVLAETDIELVTVRDFPDLPEPIEDGDSFVANARLKANSAWAFTGVPSLADDSGLVVPSLGGVPGVYSARYAGVEGEGRDQANRDKLRQALRDEPTLAREAYFVTVIVLRWGDEEEMVFEGRCPGMILDEERGEQGFGYDSIFLIPSLGKTFAELASVDKNAISHRGLALKKFQRWLEDGPFLDGMLG